MFSLFAGHGGRRQVDLGRLLAAVLCLCAVLYGVFLLVRDDPDDRPYLRIAGKSFVFNYRVADVYAGFTAIAQKPIPVGSVMEVHFENPQGPPLVVRRQIGGADRSLSLRSPPMRGIRAHHPYDVTIRLLSREDGREFARQSFEVRSNISDALVPENPLTVGPGYHRPPKPSPAG